MTRIGRVKTYEGYYPSTPYFRLVVEDGQVQLGCWRAVAQEPADWIEKGASPRTIYERVS